VRPGELPNLPAAAVWGLTRTAAAEYPGRVVSVDLDDWAGVAWPALLGADEPQLAVRCGRAYAPRLTRAAAPAPDEPARAAGAPAPPAEGTVLITGGTGGLGAVVARHLAEAGARHLVLASRRGPRAEGVEDLVASLAALGAEVTVSACDFGEREAVVELLGSVPDERPLKAVIHAAGIMEDGTIPSITPDQADRVLRPKVDGALHLHELTEQLELTEFVLFSSAAPLLGGAGQGSYAAANAVLDALAQRRRARGLPARSLAWGLWNQASGLVDVDDGDVERLARTIRARLGLIPIAPEDGLELFDRARLIDAAVVVPAPLDFGVLRALARDGSQPAVVRGLVPSVDRARHTGAMSVVHRLAGAPESEREALLLDVVRRELAAVLGHDSLHEVDAEVNMLELGLDSLGAVELRNRLSRAIGLPIAPTLAFDHPTTSAMAAEIARRVREESPPPGAPSAETSGLPPAHASAAGTMSALLREAHERDALDEFLPLLTAASSFRPAFGSTTELEHLPHVASLGRGEGTQLIGIPSFLAGSGPHQFARLAGELSGRRSVYACSLPGYRAGGLLPETWEAAVGALAASVRETAGNQPFALVGYSIGGALAHALARRLEDDGVPPAGVIMLDTYAPESPDEMWQVFGAVMGTVLDMGHELMAVDDDNLMAMGAYVRLLGEWEPRPIAAPSLLVRASEPLGDAYTAGRLPRWQCPPDVVEVTGHHFGLILETVSETAQVVDAWSRERFNEREPVER
jgi:hypothetical protein